MPLEQVEHKLKLVLDGEWKRSIRADWWELQHVRFVVCWNWRWSFNRLARNNPLNTINGPRWVRVCSTLSHGANVTRSRGAHLPGRATRPRHNSREFGGNFTNQNAKSRTRYQILFICYATCDAVALIQWTFSTKMAPRCVEYLTLRPLFHLPLSCTMFHS